MACFCDAGGHAWHAASPRGCTAVRLTIAALNGAVTAIFLLWLLPISIGMCGSFAGQVISEKICCSAGRDPYVQTASLYTPQHTHPLIPSFPGGINHLPLFSTLLRTASGAPSVYFCLSPHTLHCMVCWPCTLAGQDLLRSIDPLAITATFISLPAPAAPPVRCPGPSLFSLLTSQPNQDKRGHAAVFDHFATRPL